MREASQFTRERAIYWPGEFSDVVGLLTGKDSSGNVIAQPIYQFNTGAIILAASLGVKNMRKREVGADRKEITTTTFSSQGLERYIFLIAMLGDPDGCVGLLRPDNEERASDFSKTIPRYGELQSLRKRDGTEAQEHVYSIRRGFCSQYNGSKNAERRHGRFHVRRFYGCL